MSTENKEYTSFIQDILIILVLYKADLHKSKSFISFSDILQGTDIKVDMFIYDNSPQPSFIYEQTSNLNIHYINDPSNPGVGKAYNEGCKLAQQLGKKWLLLADQDTIFSKDLFQEFYQSSIEYPDIHLFVPKLMHNKRLLSPCKFVGRVGRALSGVSSGLHSFAKMTVLNSGMFISTESFSKTGGFSEKIKLDFADFFFINNYKKIYPSFFVTNSICIHELSSLDDDAAKTLIRFRIYCRDGRSYSDNFATFIIVAYFVFRRTVKLLFRYRKFTFLKIYLTDFLFQKST